MWEHKGVSVLSTPDLCAADKDQIRFALDPLIGIEVHLVVTLDSFSQQLYGGWLAELRAGGSTGWDKYVGRVLEHAVDGTREHAQAEQFWAGHELVSILARWGWTFHADRLHVVAQQDVTGHWREFAGLAGLSADELPAVVPPYADPAGVAVLRKVNRQLDEPVGSRLRRPAGARPTRSAARCRSRRRRRCCRWSSGGTPRWRRRGTTSAATWRCSPRTTAEQALPGPRDQLGVAVDALADALAANAGLRTRVAELEDERDRLDRKRRKWKHRAQAARWSLRISA